MSIRYVMIVADQPEGCRIRMYNKEMMTKTALIIFALLLCTSGTTEAQRDFYNTYSFNRADSLRGSLRAERSCYDVFYYDLDIRVDPISRMVSGQVDIHFTAVTDFERMQVDLFENMRIIRIDMNGRKLHYVREHNAVFVDLPQQSAGNKGTIRITYGGKPVQATNPPWDGGFVWANDRNGNPWIAVACEGDGASLWWPNKDHLSDEPDSLSIRVSVPEPLVCISNGNLRSERPDPKKKGYRQYEWFVSYPINNYNVTVNIGDYTHFSDIYTAEDGASLDLDYYVMSYNLERARTHFRQTHQTLACFEEYFGKYPFWEDGFALVETPYLGMEHQSAIAYGNRYMRGYLGGMIPSDMDWDYIIVHETGHEYFGNSISVGDLSEMWIHESFTTYMEALYVECRYSREDAIRYLLGQRGFIGNREPILGPPGVNWEDWEYSDHYFKGSWVLHTLRSAINDDELWFDILRSFYEEYQHSIVTTSDFTEFVKERTGSDYDAFFEQYLWHPKPPTLTYQLLELDGNLIVRFKWAADVADFSMPVHLGVPGNMQFVQAEARSFSELVIPDAKATDFEVSTELFYINTLELD